MWRIRRQFTPGTAKNTQRTPMRTGNTKLFVIPEYSRSCAFIAKLQGVFFAPPTFWFVRAEKHTRARAFDFDCGSCESYSFDIFSLSVCLLLNFAVITMYSFQGYHWPGRPGRIHQALKFPCKQVRFFTGVSFLRIMNFNGFQVTSWCTVHMGRISVVFVYNFTFVLF